MSTPTLYADLSGYYDLLCSAIDYRQQCDFAVRVHGLFGNGGHRYLDLACGSGAHLELMSEHGFICSGLDISAPMLALAAQRCPKAQLYLLDMSELSIAQPVDFITCFLYSLHYSHPRQKFTQTLQKVYEALAPGGLFCFDAVDKFCVANDSGHRHSANHQLHFQTRWHYSGGGETLHLHVDIRDQNQRYYEQHLMSALSIVEVEQELNAIGFDVEILERDFERLIPWHGINGNVIFCASKPAKAFTPER